jgi:hypothetical protein
MSGTIRSVESNLQVSNFPPQTYAMHTDFKQVEVLHSEPASGAIVPWHEDIMKRFVALIETKFAACVDVLNIMLTKIYNNPSG